MAQEQLQKHGLSLQHQAALGGGALLTTLLGLITSAASAAPQIIALVQSLIAAFQKPAGPVTPSTTSHAADLVKLGFNTATVDAMAAQGLDLSSILTLIQEIVQYAPQAITVFEAIVAALQLQQPKPPPVSLPPAA